MVIKYIYWKKKVANVEKKQHLTELGHYINLMFCPKSNAAIHVL